MCLSKYYDLIVLLPLSYIQGGGGVSSTAQLAHLHADFEQKLLSAGEEIPPRWRLLRRQEEDSSSQPAMEESEPETLELGDESTTMTEGENETVESSTTASGVQAATAVSVGIAMPQQVNASSTDEAMSSSLSAPLPNRSKLHNDLCHSIPSEASRSAKEESIKLMLTLNCHYCLKLSCVSFSPID